MVLHRQQGNQSIITSQHVLLLKRRKNNRMGGEQLLEKGQVGPFEYCVMV